MTRRQTTRWTIGFGAWWGVAVRLHMLLVLFAVVTLSITAGDGLLAEGAVMLSLLVLSIALHEAAHTIAAIKLGGEVDEVVLTPVGGLRAPRVPDEPEPQVFVAMIGPMANLALVVLATGVLVYLREMSILPLFNPVGPEGLLQGSLSLVAVKLTLWINWTLFLLNLLPAYPFDGGPALRAVLWPMLGRRTAAVAAAHTARVLAVGFCFVAVIIEKNDPQAVLPLWAPLITLAVFLLFSSQQDLMLAHSMDVAPPREERLRKLATRSSLLSDDWADEGEEMVLVEHGQESKQMQRDAKRRAEEAYEDARVDDILARLHHQGIDNLTPEERRVLERASARYRDRRQSE